MGRLLDIESYGVFSSILATLTMLASPSSVLSTLVTKQVAKLNIKKNYIGILQLYKRYFIFFIFTVVIFQFICIIYGDKISKILTIEQSMLYWIGCAACSLILMSISSGIFYGVQKFTIAALIGVLYPALKIILCCILVLLGMEVLGATLGILLAASIAVFYAAFQIFQFPIEKNATSIEAESLGIKKILMMLLANTLFTFMLQMDIIVVNHFFGPDEGGIYASAATLGKSILYLPGGIAIALLATAGSDQIKKKYDHQTLTYAISLTLICCLALASFMYLFSELIIKITFGDSYLQASKLLGLYAFAMCPWALVLVLENYLIALDKYFLTWIYLLGAIVQCMSIYYFHSDPYSILYIVGFLGIITSIIGLMFAWIEFGLTIKMKF